MLYYDTDCRKHAVLLSFTCMYMYVYIIWHLDFLLTQII